MSTVLMKNPVSSMNNAYSGALLQYIIHSLSNDLSTPRTCPSEIFVFHKLVQGRKVSCRNHDRGI